MDSVAETTHPRELLQSGTRVVKTRRISNFHIETLYFLLSSGRGREPGSQTLGRLTTFMTALVSFIITAPHQGVTFLRVYGSPIE